MMHIAWRPVSLGGGPEISTSITDAETAELQRLAAGRQVLEIGSAWGYSAIAMALGGAGHVTAVDPHAELGSAEAMRENLAAYGVTGKVTMILARSSEALPALAARGESFGLIFIDGDHSAVSVARDVALALQLLEPGGTLACHDYDEDCQPGVRSAVDPRFRSGPTRLTDTLFILETAGAS